ncbi:MAG TPA: hypothetical protein PLM00_01505 [Spirochaetota bacterium]|nr:hypothetical protein [Spirochaetota bacterium]HPN82034.1 hypothetical protein [Spirochaetota bacterium]
MKRSSRFVRIKFFLLLLAAIPIVLGTGLAIHSSLLSHGVSALQSSLVTTDSAKSQSGRSGPETHPAGRPLTELAAHLERYSTLGLIAGIAGLLLLLILIVSLHRGRLGIYCTCFRKALHTASDRTVLDLETLRFPDEDDLGQLGQALNGIVSRLREYDALRRDELLLADSTVRTVISTHEQALAVFDDQLTLVFFSGIFSDLLGGRSKAGLKTSDLFTDATTLEQLVQSLHKDGKTELPQRPAADTIIPLLCVTLTVQKSSARRLLVQFGKASGDYV